MWYWRECISRCRYGSIRVPDRDAAGEKTKSRWISNRYVTLSTPMKYKDSDELCFINKDATEEERKFNQDWLCRYIDMCANWLKTAEHHGYKCECKETTMI